MTHFSRSVDVRNIYKLEGRNVKGWVHIYGGKVSFSIFRAGNLEWTNQSEWTFANYLLTKLLWLVAHKLYYEATAI